MSRVSPRSRMATYRFNDVLTLFGGLRYMTETKESVSHALTCPTNPITCRAFRLPTRTEPLEAPVDLETDEPSGSVGLRYQVTDDVMVYGSVARGVKSAAVNNSRNPVADYARGILVADPSFVTSYELGVKASLFERRAELNFAVFDMNYTDLQVRNQLFYLRRGGASRSKIHQCCQGFDPRVRA